MVSRFVYEVAGALRADPVTENAVLVALTGWGTDNDQRHAAEAGFNFHLTKPAEAEQVYELLDRVVLAGRDEARL